MWCTPHLDLMQHYRIDIWSLCGSQMTGATQNLTFSFVIFFFIFIVYFFSFFFSSASSSSSSFFSFSPKNNGRLCRYGTVYTQSHLAQIPSAVCCLDFLFTMFLGIYHSQAFYLYWWLLKYTSWKENKTALNCNVKYIFFIKLPSIVLSSFLLEISCTLFTRWWAGEDEAAPLSKHCQAAENLCGDGGGGVRCFSDCSYWNLLPWYCTEIYLFNYVWPITPLY